MNEGGKPLFLNTYRTTAIKAVVLTGKLRKHDEKIIETFKQLPPMHVFLLKENLSN